MVIAQWKAASTRWRQHVTVVPAGRDQQPKIVLDVGEWMEPPADGVARATCQVVTDPFDQLSGASQLRMANDPAFAAFEKVSLDLAEAASAIAVTLEENAIDSTVALQVARDLRRIPRRPTAAVYAAIDQIDLQVDRIGVRTRSPGTQAGSAAQHVAPSDPREAFHRATMAVYRDLGALVDVLRREPDLRVALLAIDECVTHGGPPDRSDSAFVADLKHAAGLLRSSLATASAIHDQAEPPTMHRGHGGSFGGIATISYHRALLSAAATVFEMDAEGAAQTGLTAPPQGSSGLIRRQVIEAAMDSRQWSQLAENLQHEHRSTSFLPNPPSDAMKRAARPIDEVQTQHPVEVDFAEAMERYDRSCDEMRTVRLSPGRVIPADQWPEEPQLGGGAISRVKDWKQYARYVLRVAARNERYADQARVWWAWWEKSQVDPSMAGPPPLVSPRIELALRIAAQQRARRLEIMADGVTDPANALTTPSPAAGPADRLVTVEEAAHELGKPEKTIRNWIQKGDALQPVDRLGGPRKVAARYRLRDIRARRPDRS